MKRKKVRHPIDILMRPMMVVLEKRMEDILMLAYNQGVKDGSRVPKMPPCLRNPPERCKFAADKRKDLA